MGLNRTRRHRQCRDHVESLEQRAMFSVVNVTPGNYVAAIGGSHNGDTINFAPGEYDLNQGSTFQVAGNRNYIGNGAVFKGGGNSILDMSDSTDVDFSGFVLDGTGVSAERADGINFHNNTIKNASVDGFTVNDMSDSHVDNNTFTGMTAGLYGYPLGGNTVDGNRFDYVGEPVHFICFNTADGMDVSQNVITHAKRIGIELQNRINNLTVSNNTFSDWLQNGSGGDDSHMAISCATGGNGEAPYTNQAQHVTISGNVMIQNGPAQNVAVWAKSAIEIMGYSDIHISQNYSWNWGNFLLNGAVGDVDSSDNIVVGSNTNAGDRVGWPIGGITGSGNQLFALNSPNAPAWPSAASATDVQPAAPTVAANPSPKPVKTPKPKAAPAPKTSAQTTANQQIVKTIHSVLR